MDAVNPPRRLKTLMATLEAGELMKLLKSAETLRDRAILTLIMDNGMRAGEVCSLLKHNIKQETVVVNGKIGWREVPISDETKH
jgi:integrase